MAEFEESFNYDDIFFRDITVSLTSQLYSKIKWKNVFQDGGDKWVTIPFFYSFTGDDRFLLDAFVDDITGIRPDMNIDPVPRATVTMTNWTRKTSEIANPNVRLMTYRDVDGEIQKVTGYYRQIPLKVSYEVAITLASEGDIWKCSEALFKFFELYRHFRFEHKYMRHNAVMTFPDTHAAELQRQFAGIDGDNNKTIKFSIDVNTHFFIDPSEAEPITTNKKVIFKGYAWNSNTAEKNPIGWERMQIRIR